MCLVPIENWIKRKVRIDYKISLLTRKTISVLIFPLNDLHFSHTLSTLLTRTPHIHHEYSPSSVMTKLHPLPHASPSSTHSPTSAADPPMVRAHNSTPRTNERETQLHPTRNRRSEVPPPTLAKPISPPTFLIRCSHVTGETLLSNPPSTIFDPPKTDLVLDPPKTDLITIAEDRYRR